MPTDTRAMVQELRALQGPVLARAVLCLVFGLVTVFWQPSHYWAWGDPGQQGVRWTVGAFMLLHGGCLFLMQQRLAGAVREASAERSALQSVAALYALGGAITVLFARETTQLVLIVGLVYGLAGLMELLLGMRSQERLAMGRDWKIAGFVTVLTAAGLFLFGEMGPKADFGIVGGGAMVVGVFHVLAALTFRHDAAVLERQDRA